MVSLFFGLICQSIHVTTDYDKVIEIQQRQEMSGTIFVQFYPETIKKLMSEKICYFG